MVVGVQVVCRKLASEEAPKVCMYVDCMYNGMYQCNSRPAHTHSTRHHTEGAEAHSQRTKAKSKAGNGGRENGNLGDAVWLRV